MAETVTLTVRLTRETKDRLDALALSARRSKAFLAGEAIGEAVAEADAGGVFFEHEDVMDYLERRARGERPQRLA